jgi:hypothetical protein
MKKIILVVTLMIISLKSFSQLNITDTTETFLKHSAGYELHLASRHYFTGFGIITAGVVIGVLGGTSYPTTPGNIRGFEIFTGVTTLLGSIFIIESHIHLKGWYNFR